jgi:hypothetical protein
MGGEDNKIYLITADLGNHSGAGLDFISCVFHSLQCICEVDTRN